MQRFAGMLSQFEPLMIAKAMIPGVGPVKRYNLYPQVKELKPPMKQSIIASGIPKF